MYTKGKWEREGIFVCKSLNKEDAEYIVRAEPGLSTKTQIDNLKRICECVNGYDELKAQRDALLEACKKLSGLIRVQNPRSFNGYKDYQEAQSAIAKTRVD